MSGAKLSRRALAQQRLEQALPLLRCPLCAEALALAPGGLLCRRGHQFDIAKTGYVNFASAGSPENYGRTLFLGRRRVFLAGLFGPVLEAVASILKDRFPRPFSLLDAGCGEGFYLKALADRLGDKNRYFGVDLARDGVALATQHEAPALFFVADLSRLPFTDSSIDVILNVLSPASYAEFGRVLGPGGIVVKAVPRAGHLAELRGALGLAAPPASESGALELAARHIAGAPQRLRYTASVGPSWLGDLVAMTPLAAHAQSMPQALEQVTLDIELFAGELRNPKRS